MVGLLENMLDNKTALILGASGGIGSQISLKLALEGCIIIGIGTNEKKLKKVKREIEDVKGVFHYFITDIRDESKVKLTIKKIFDEFNGIDFIINSVGKYRMGLFLDIPIEAYKEVIDTNLTSIINFYFNFLSEYKKRIKENNKIVKLKHVIDIISLIQLIIYGGNAVAAASKAGLMTFSLDLSKELEWMKKSNNQEIKKDAEILSNIRFSRLYPENVDTDIYSDFDKSNPIWPIDSFPKFSPSIVANEILNLITNEEYKNINDVSIRIFKKDVITSLHTLNENGVPDLINPVKKYKRGEILDLYIKDTNNMGKGVFAGKNFRKGELIFRVTGKVINHQTEHSFQIDFDKHIEADYPARFINHSCDPTAGVKTDKNTGFPNIIAFKNINKDEQITIDWAMTELKHYPRDNPKLEFDLTCRCGSKICRGKFGYYSELSDELKKKYKGFILDYLISS